MRAVKDECSVKIDEWITTEEMLALEDAFFIDLEDEQYVKIRPLINSAYNKLVKINECYYKDEKDWEEKDWKMSSQAVEDYDEKYYGIHPRILPVRATKRVELMIRINEEQDTEV